MLKVQSKSQLSTVNFKSGTTDIKQIRSQLAELAKNTEIKDGEIKGDYLKLLFSLLKTAGIFRKDLRVTLTEKLEALFNKQESKIETMKKGYESKINDLTQQNKQLSDELEQLKRGVADNRPYKVTCDGYGDIFLTYKGIAQYNKILTQLTTAEGKHKKCRDTISDAQSSIAVCKHYYPISAPQEMKPYESIISNARIEIGNLDGQIKLYKSQIQMLKDNGELPD